MKRPKGERKERREGEWGRGKGRYAERRARAEWRATYQKQFEQAFLFCSREFPKEKPGLRQLNRAWANSIVGSSTPVMTTSSSPSPPPPPPPSSTAAKPLAEATARRFAALLSALSTTTSGSESAPAALTGARLGAGDETFSRSVVEYHQVTPFFALTWYGSSSDSSVRSTVCTVPGTPGRKGPSLRERLFALPERTTVSPTFSTNSGRD